MKSKHIGYQFKCRRIFKGLTQKEVSKLLGISQACLSRKENDKEGFTLDQFVALADLYNSPDEFLLQLLGRG